MVKSIFKKILPLFAKRFLTGLFYGWHGNYTNWEVASQKCTGYDAQLILDKVKKSAELVKSGEAKYERDSCLFDQIEYNFPLLSGLMWIAAQNKGKLNVLDFGGSLGSSYFQNKKFLDSLAEVKWCVVEQANFVKTGLEQFEDDRLKFYYHIDDCIKKHEIHVILLSSVLQYLEKPYELLDEIKLKNIKYVIIDRTGFIKGSDRITIQKVHPAIYKASYPCWFINQNKFMEYMNQNYELVLGFDALDQANFAAEFKGFILKKI